MKKSLAVGLLTTYALAESYLYSSERGIPQYPSANLGYLSYQLGGVPSSSSQDSANRAINQAIDNAKGNIGTVNRSIDSLFLRLPSSQQLDRLILNADSVAILKTIQTVATNDSLTCDQRLAYLQEILGRIKNAVQKKKFAADQLKVIIDGARSEITRLEQEIERLENSVKSLWLSQLQNKLNSALANLQALYRQFNQVQRSIAPKEAILKGYKKQITIIDGASDAERNRISSDKLKLTEAQAQIRSLQSRLAIARDQRGILEASIKNSQRIISENDNKIRQARDNIGALEEQIIRLQNNVDSLRGKYADLEIEVERLRTEISIASTKADAYRTQIASLQDRINIERDRIVIPELDKINQMIVTLKRLISTVQRQIDRHYYYCYGEGAIKTEQQQGVVVYIVKGERFDDFVHNSFGQNTQTKQQSLKFFNIDIFDNVWTNKFGYPFPRSNLGGNSDNFDIAGSFNCLNPSKAVQGLGRIHSISADYIEIDSEKGERSQLYLSACSRLEATKKLPQVGQNIAYSGIPSGKGDRSYNLYKASCWN